MKADEVFVLLLIGVCVAAIAALAIQSRRQQRAAADPDAQTPAGSVTMPEAQLDEKREGDANPRRKRRR